MNKIFTILMFFLLFTYYSYAADAIIIDHTCCDLGAVPEHYVEQVKNNFSMAYGHTSHGSQIISGITLLDGAGSIYHFHTSGDEEGSLKIDDGNSLGGDLGNPDRTTWATRTRSYLQQDTHNTNVIMWSWCGQADGSEDNINTYLNLMNQLEIDFPDITFIYMTGHLNGSGEDGNVNQRNNQIRQFCQENGKILFDFADIESYDPDGNYFLDQDADDACNYNGGNWADEWCAKHPGECENCSCAHSKCLNCQQKGKAFWWMMARIAGWDGETSVEESPKFNIRLFQSYPNPANDAAYINFILPQASNVSLKLYDVEGNLVKTLIDGEYYEAEVKLETKLDTKGLVSGTYEYRLEANGKIAAKKLTIVK